MKPKYEDNFIEGPEYLWIWPELLNLEWETKRAARHEYFMSDNKVNYSYGRKDDGISYDSRPFTETVQYILDLLDETYDLRFNGCFLNKYDNQHQHLGWHADDFEGMDSEFPIAVVSFGAEREIWVKPQGAKGIVPTEDRYLLKKGSIFIMPRGYQDAYFHRIPKHPEPCEERISLTFRKFL